MEISGVQVDGFPLPYTGNTDSTGLFRSFMNYCIDNHLPLIAMTPELSKFFSPAANDPVFKSAIVKGCVEEHLGMHYSTNSGTPEKIGIMVHISNILTIDLFVQTF